MCSETCNLSKTLHKRRTETCRKLICWIRRSLLAERCTFISKTVFMALAIESISCSYCNTFDMPNISFQPFIVCISFFFHTIVGELFTPCVEGSFNSVYVLKYLINQLVLSANFSCFLIFTLQVLIESKSTESSSKRSSI